MDPLSIIASTIAVGGAATAASRCAQAFYKIAHKAGVISEDVTLFAYHIDNFGSSVSSVHNTIREHFMKYQQSLVLQRLNSQSTLKKLAYESRILMKRLRGLEPDVKDRGVGLGMIGRAKWFFKSKEREELCIWMERVKMSFLMIMYEVIYEALQQRALSPEPLPPGLFDLQREMKDHTRQMKRLIRTMKILRSRHENMSSRRSQQSEEDRGHSLNEIENIVLGMGQSMILQGSSKSSFNVSSTFSTQPSDDSSSYEARSNTSPVMSAHDRNPQIYGQLPPFRRPTRAPQTPPTSPDGEEASSTVLSFPSTRNEELQTWPEGDYMDVQASENVLHLNPNLNSEAITGYSNGSTQPTEAKLNSEFPRNVISEQEAARLNLDVEYDDDEENGTQIDFGGTNGSRQHALGKVTILWSKSQERNLRPLRVTCLVYEYLPYHLIFGEAFLRKRRHYWRE